MKKIMVLFIFSPFLAFYCTGCIGCGCTPPKMFIFILDSAGTNMNAKYKGIQLRYEMEGRKRSISDISTMGGAGLAPYRERDTAAFAFASIEVLEAVQKYNLQNIELVFQDSIMANITLQVHKELFTKDYIIDKATLNGKSIFPVLPGEAFTYIFRLW